jgi:hypothetical protein
VKNWQKTVGIEGKLDIISRLAKSEQTVDMCHNVGPTRISTCTVHDNVDRIKESAKSGTRVFVKADYHSPIGMNHTKSC